MQIHYILKLEKYNFSIHARMGEIWMKKIISLITVLSILFSMTVTIGFAAEVKGAERFKDLKMSDWHYSYVDRLTKLGAISGLPNGTFAPNRTITRGEFIKIVVATTVGSQQPKEGHWAGSSVKKAEEIGLLFPDEFKVNTLDTPILRGEMAKVIARCMDQVLHEEPIVDTEPLTKNITDWSTICVTCKPDIAQAYGKGIIAGMTDKSFSGAKSATRAEATTMIVRLIDKSYRYQLIGNVPFTPLVDVATDGRMKQAKAKQYMDQTLDSIEFYKENGKYYVKGTFSDLPQGFEHWMDITIIRKDKPLILYTNGFTMIKEQVIPNKSAFIQEIVGLTSLSEIQTVEIQLGINAPNSTAKGEGFESHYSVSTQSLNTIALISNVNHGTQYLKYSVTKLFKW